MPGPIRDLDDVMFGGCCPQGNDVLSFRLVVVEPSIPEDQRKLGTRHSVPGAAWKMRPHNTLKRKGPMSAKKILPEDQAIGRQIRSQRLAKGMSQTDLANHIGVTFQQVQKYEKGVNRVSGGRLQQIAALFDIHVADLMGVPQKRVNGNKNDVFVQLGQTREGHRVAKAFNDIAKHHEVRLAFVLLAERVSEALS